MLQEYIKVYKNYYSKDANCNALCEDTKISSHVLSVFDDIYNCNDKLQYIIDNCKLCGIYTFNDYNHIICNHIRSVNYIFDSHVFNKIASVESNLINTYGITQNMSIYDNTARTYLSIDIKHAFSQYVDSLNIFPSKFDELILCGLPSFMQESKSIRMLLYYQIIDHFRLRRNIVSLFDKVFASDDDLVQLILLKNKIPVTYNFDELIFDITDDPDFDKFLGSRTIANIDLSISKFTAHTIAYIDPLVDQEKTLHIRKYTDHMYYVEKCCKYITQLHKVLNNLPIEDLDMYYIDDFNKLHKLSEPIKITNIT